MKAVIVSPLRGLDVAQDYIDQIGAYCVREGWSPWAGHAFLPRFMDDSDPDVRERAFALSKPYIESGDVLVVGLDHGFSDGMRRDVVTGARAGLALHVVRLETQADGVDDDVRALWSEHYPGARFTIRAPEVLRAEIVRALDFWGRRHLDQAFHDLARSVER